jgi:K+-sensing histidine kinase KdpD
MAEVLGNLVSNAVKFTPPGGRVTLTAEPCPDFGGAGADGTAVRLCVEDTGVGIAPEQLPHIFDKFYQANNQARASAAGSGLGLAITKQIVEAHGGVIGAESTPDVGTRFVLLLPLDATGLASTAFGPLSEAERADVTPAVASVLGASHSAASDGAASIGAAPTAAASASAGGTRA